MLYCYAGGKLPAKRERRDFSSSVSFVKPGKNFWQIDEK